MGPWESVIVVLSSLAGAFFAVMGFRGLIETLDDYSGKCAACGRTTLLPLPPQTLRCRRCHDGVLHVGHRFARRTQLPH
ncbi:MAG TPA: hypothetical protein VFH66_01180 [Mycobacteriales bacterium]|nr:hypothetical protein [Mycobacteriales bacterium]